MTSSTVDRKQINKISWKTNFFAIVWYRTKWHLSINILFELLLPEGRPIIVFHYKKEWKKKIQKKRTITKMSINSDWAFSERSRESDKHKTETSGECKRKRMDAKTEHFRRMLKWRKNVRPKLGHQFIRHVFEHLYRRFCMHWTTNTNILNF